MRQNSFYHFIKPIIDTIHLQKFANINFTSTMDAPLWEVVNPLYLFNKLSSTIAQAKYTKAITP